ncbi:hypothetical protein [Bacillus sp. 165]|uniref:hypothetical protein n=1 Tax=Bacillus sp. 165 TaxID=1529117 RepID=UPI001ADCDE7E|nr:hypothetical protein [Bacillus sp. 165]MBO9130532.1 hypothetical protein [Bacillus sp. 165]
MELEKYKQLRTEQRPLIHPAAKNNMKIIFCILLTGVIFLFGYMVYGVLHGSSIITVTVKSHNTQPTWEIDTYTKDG